MDRRTPTGSSITRALRVVEAVAAAGDGVTAKAIARRLGCPLPTVYRALGIAGRGGLPGPAARRARLRAGLPGGRAAPQPRRAGPAARRRPRRAARGAHRRPARPPTWSCSGTSTSRSRTSTTARSTPGRRRCGSASPPPPHAIAAGKVMLAALRPGRLAELLTRSGLPRLAPRTVADRRALDRELMRVRSDGAAVEVEEYQAGVAGVAAPVPGPDGELAGAIGVACRRASSPPGAGSWSGWCAAPRRVAGSRPNRPPRRRPVSDDQRPGARPQPTPRRAGRGRSIRLPSCPRAPNRRSAPTTSAACCVRPPCWPPAPSTPPAGWTPPGCGPSRTPRSGTRWPCRSEVGLRAATDGEFRRTSWHMDFIYQLGGISRTDEQIRVRMHNAAGETTFTTAGLAVARARSGSTSRSSPTTSGSWPTR